MPAITVNMDEDDFQHLAITSMRWCYPGGRNDWIEQEGRFELHRDDTEINWQYGYAFWLGTEWTTVLLARAYLDTLGHPYQILWDLAENPDMSWVLLTDYETASWAQIDALPPRTPRPPTTPTSPGK